MRLHLGYAAFASLLLGVGLTLWIDAATNNDGMMLMVISLAAWSLATASPWVRGGAALATASIVLGVVLGALMESSATVLSSALTMFLLVAGWEGLDLARRIRIRVRGTTRQGAGWAGTLLGLHAIRLALVLALASGAVLGAQRMLAFLLVRFTPARFADSVEAAGFTTAWLASAVLFAIVGTVFLLWPPERRASRRSTDAVLHDAHDAGNSAAGMAASVLSE